MEFAEAGGVEGGDIGGAELAAGEEGEAVVGSANEGGEGVAALEGGGGLAGGEDAVDAEAVAGFEGGEGVGGEVEGLVEGDGEGAGGGDEGGGAGLVDGEVGIQEAEDDAGCAEVAGELDVGSHGLELGIGGVEVAFAGADQDADGYGEALADGPDRAGAGGDAAGFEALAELDAVAPPAAAARADSTPWTQISRRGG